MSDLESRVIQTVAEQLEVNEDEIQLDSAFIEDLGADSIDTVELVMRLEETFDVEISEDEAKQLTTVQAVVDHIRKVTE